MNAMRLDVKKTIIVVVLASILLNLISLLIRFHRGEVNRFLSNGVALNPNQGAGWLRERFVDLFSTNLLAVLLFGFAFAALGFRLFHSALMKELCAILEEKKIRKVFLQQALFASICGLSIYFLVRMAYWCVLWIFWYDIAFLRFVFPFSSTYVFGSRIHSVPFEFVCYALIPFTALVFRLKFGFVGSVICLLFFLMMPSINKVFMSMELDVGIYFELSTILALNTLLMCMLFGILSYISSLFWIRRG